MKDYETVQAINEQVRESENRMTQFIAFSLLLIIMACGHSEKVRDSGMYGLIFFTIFTLIRFVAIYWWDE